MVNWNAASSAILAVAAKEKVDWNEAWGTVLTGIVIVFIALVALVLIVMLFGKISASVTEKAKAVSAAPAPAKPAPAAPAPVAAAPAAVPAGEDMDEIAAVITAALATVLAGEESGKSYVVKSIKRVRNTGSAWRSAGLAENLSSF